MPKFLTTLKVDVLGDNTYKLIAPLIYESKKVLITVHTSFDFDGASIPQSLWTAIGCPMGGKYSRASCLHDALYASRLFSRKDCDKFFHEAMIADGVSKAKALEFYLAVRAFGDSYYDEYENLDKYRNLIQVEAK